MIGIVASIGDEATNWPDPLQQGARDTDIVDIAGRQQQGQWPAPARRSTRGACSSCRRATGRLLGGRPPFSAAR